MQNNPIAMMMQMMRGGQNPMQMIMQMASTNQQFAPAIQLIQGKSPQQLEQTFYNLCKSNGIDPSQFAGQFGLNLPVR